MWYLVGFISAIDVYYAIKFSTSLPTMEENPLGKYLIRIAGGDISLFIGCKVAGLFLFQMWLFLYMHDYFIPGSINAYL